MMQKVNESKVKRPSLLMQIFILAITGIIIAFVIILSIRTQNELKKTAIEQFNQQQLILARSAATGIETYFNELSAALSVLTKLFSFKQMTPECLRHMEHTYWGFPERTSIRLIDENGVLRYIYPFDGWRREQIGKNYSKEAYFQKAGKTGGIITSRLIVNEQGELRTRIAVPIFMPNKAAIDMKSNNAMIATPIKPGEEKRGRFKGILVGSLDPHMISRNLISPIISGKTGYAWVLDSNGIILSHYIKEFIGRNALETRRAKNPNISYAAIEKIQHRMMAGDEGKGFYISGWHRGHNGLVEKMVAYSPVHLPDKIWSVAVCAPVNEIEYIIKKAKHSEWYTIVFVTFTLIISGFFFFITSYRWSRSLEFKVAKQTKEIRATRDYLDNLIRHANAPIIVWTPDRQATIFNQAFEKMTGRTEAEMLEQPLEVLFHGESRFDSLQKIERALKGEYWKTVEIPILGKNGEIRIVLWNSANIYDEDGKTVIATIAQGQDITERKLAEEALRESEEKYRSIMEAMNDAAYICSPDFRIEYMNPAMKKRISYDAIGEPCHKVMHGFDEKCPWCIHARVMQGEHIQSEVVGPKNGKIYHVSNSPIFHTDGSVSKLTISRNITEIKKMEEKLQQAQKMESIGTLAGGIAHDFNNILATMIGCTELSLIDASKETVLHENLQEALRAGMRAKDLVKQILTFSRQADKEVKPLRAQTIIREVLKLSKSTLPSTIEIKQHINNQCGLVMADPTQVNQIAMNLIANAYHAMEDEGGILEITLKEVDLGPEELKNPDMNPGTYVCLTVADTGIGMDKALMNRIFEPYFTTKAKNKGTGLGLSVVHGIVKSYKGDIRVYSEPGKGTAFHVYLPVIKTRVEIEGAEVVVPIQKGSERILLVDDEEPVLHMEKQILERLGYHVTVRTASVEALEAFRAAPDKFDLVITDMTMPNMTGVQLSQKLIKIRPEIPIIICTGFSEKISDEKVKAMGIRGYVMKPVIISKLSKTLRTILDDK